MNLKHLNDKSLLKDTKSLVEKERACITQLLHHLKEIESRRLFADLKYGSLFEYAVKELGYSEAAANRRIHSARLLKDFPELKQKFETGEINLTTATMASQLIKNENVKDIAKKQEIVSSVTGKTKKEAEKALTKFVSKPVQSYEGAKIVSNDLYALTIHVSEETLKKFENLKRILGHTKASTDGLFNFMLETAMKEAEKRKAKLTDKPKTAPAQSPEARVVTAKLKREVYLRDRGVCQNCKSNFKLEYDHRYPFSLGGKTTAENLRLLCFSCNQRQRIQMKFSSA